MRKEIYIIIGLVAVLSVAMVSVAQADPLSFTTATAVNTSYGGRLTDYTISFQVGSSTEIESQIVITFPTGFDVSRASAETYTTATSSVTAPSSTGSSIYASSTVSGQGIIAWLADGSVTPASDTVEVTINNIQNPYAGDTSAVVDVQTRTQDGGNIDSESSTAFTIFASPKADVEAPADKTAPFSLLMTPSAAVTISAGEEYVIKGMANDSGGSSVKKVEVTVDGGETWLAAERDTDFAYSATYRWKYVWSNPAEGDHTVQVRATDTEGNRESPSAGVIVTVAAAASPAPTPSPTPTPAPEKPIAEMTVTELQAKLIQVQQQVVALLQQLIQLLTAQL